MSEDVDKSLRKITGGAFIVFIGTILAMLIGMVSRILIVRSIDQDEYGIYSLCTVITSVVSTIAILGLNVGSVRQIAFFRGKGDESNVKKVVLSAIQIAGVSGIIFSLILFFGTDIISIKIFHNTELSPYLKIICISIPFSVLISILASIYRGFDRPRPNVYFSDIARNVLFSLLLFIVIVLNLSLAGVIYAFVASYVLTFIAFLLYFIKMPALDLNGIKVFSHKLITKELLFFSFPLFLVLILNNISAWTDTLMIGFFKTSADVGLYNVAIPLVHIFSSAFAAVNFLFMPLMTQLYARNQKDEIRRSFAVLTKWLFSLTLPVFLIFVLFPEASLNILFGPEYKVVAPVLQILAVGFYLHIILGPNGTTLIVMGKTRFLTWSTFIAALSNIVLNMVLIPPLGILGAAIATSVTLVIRNCLISAVLYSISRIHPFTRNYLKPAILSVISIIVISVLIRTLISPVPVWLIPILFIVFLVIYAVSILLTRSFDKEDITMIQFIENRMGINLRGIKRLLKRFI